LVFLSCILKLFRQFGISFVFHFITIIQRFQFVQMDIRIHDFSEYQSITVTLLLHHVSFGPFFRECNLYIYADGLCNSWRMWSKNGKVSMFSLYISSLKSPIVIYRKLKHWWSPIPPKSTKRTIISQLNSLNARKADHDIWRWKSRTWLGTCKHPLLMRSQPSPLDNRISNVKWQLISQYGRKCWYLSCVFFYLINPIKIKINFVLNIKNE
jgi:hypothetical protein